jgi:alkylated DNA repair dioxygenase AlkB
MYDHAVQDFFDLVIMNTLFPLEPAFPEGFAYYPDYLNGNEEQALLGAVSHVELHSFHFHGYEAKRKVASFGYDWSFEKRSLSKGKEIPAAFRSIIQKVAAHLSITETAIAELLVTEYPPGSVINWHRDAPPFDIIVGLSLLSDCVFRLRPYDKAKQKRNSLISFPVRRRSLYIIQGAARSEWEHSIAVVKEKRYSITLRTLREKVAK